MEKGIHLGLIPDGTRRWSRHNNVAMFDMLKMLVNLIYHAKRDISQEKLNNLNSITSFSVYLMSKDNVTKRTDKTVEMIQFGLNLFLEEIDCTELDISFVGELEILPKEMQEICAKIEAKCDASHGVPGKDVKSRLKIICALAYDPLEDSRRVLNDDPSSCDQSPIDLVVRTGHEIRSSGFFPLHTLYSEWFYLPKLLPDLTLKDLDTSIEQFKTRNRNFGK